MKPIITFLVLFLFASISYGQENFKVIKVNGTILLKQKNISLQTGTVFSDKEVLLFRNEDATAAVINSQKGRMILTNANHDLSAAHSNYLPSMYNISTRGANGSNIPLDNLADLQDHFSGKYVVLGKQKIEIGSSDFPMNKDNFFFLRYIYKGEVINKKLEFSNDTLVIDKQYLFTVDGKPIPSPDNTSITIYYRKGSESYEISTFDLIFPDMSQLKKEIQVILDEIKDKTVKEKIGEINGYINESYGKVYRDNLVSWLKDNFGLKTE